MPERAAPYTLQSGTRLNANLGCTIRPMQNRIMVSGRIPFLTKSALPANPPLAGQVAVITGAGRGIGRAIAVKLGELGAHTVLCGRSREALEQTAAVIRNSGGPSSENSSVKSSEHRPVKSSVIECDVTDLHSVEALARHVERTFHRIDILINNAGIASEILLRPTQKP